jgi:uncharacterized protein (TIGR00730 family)
MVLSPPDRKSPSLLKKDLQTLLADLPNNHHSKWLKKAFKILIRLAHEELDCLEWKIVSATLKDLEKGFKTFTPYYHIRKITIFGSARMTPETNEYRLAVNFAKQVTDLGFMVLTGAGGGIMQAGNEGAGRENSFGLNVKLPFEQHPNRFIADDSKLINFKYFFTRKLFFLKESDAIALFPGGFGTQDEAFETLTLCQTGKKSPIPLVLIDEPGGTYWDNWHEYICNNLVAKGFISSDDIHIYTITDNLEVACNTIREFYRVYHSSRYVEELFVMRLNYDLSEAQVGQLNQDFGDILLRGRIEKTKALVKELGDETENLPRLAFYFNPKKLGRLYQMIKAINKFTTLTPAQHHPEEK